MVHVVPYIVAQLHYTVIWDTTMLEVARNRLLALLDLDSIAIELELRECVKVAR